MLKLKEAVSILFALAVFTFVIWFPGNVKIEDCLIIAAIILFTNVLVKKITAWYFHSTAEMKVLHFQRWGYYERSHFKKPVPAGILFPFFLVLFSYPYGFLKIFTLMQTETNATLARFAKKRGGFLRLSGMTEWHSALILGWGIIANLVLAFVFLLFLKDPLFIEAAKYSAYYCFWNMLPLGMLDGTQIFFGSRLLWWCLFIISLVASIMLLAIL